MQTQKRKVLAVASTSYHLMVFLFIKDAFLKDAQVDLVLTDKSAYLYELYQSGRTDRYFHHTFFADAKKIRACEFMGKLCIQSDRKSHADRKGLPGIYYL